MTYSVFELSTQSGQPIELYEFTEGAVTHRYTSAEDVVNYAGVDYLPLQLERSAPRQESESGGKQQMEITLPSENSLAARYIGIVPATRVELQITRFHRTDSPNGEIIWTGRIVSAKFEQQGALCRLFSVSSESRLSRPIPNFKFQSLCNHVLFDGGCKAVKASFKHTATVLAVSQRTITVNGLAILGTDWALGGTVEFNGDARPIFEQNGNLLTLSLPFYESVLGETVDVFAGCDHSLPVCNSKFSNAVNFGGFAFVPTRNVFNTGL